jgi:CheY-like chemotaxis protein
MNDTASPGRVLVLEDSDEDFDTIREAADRCGGTIELKRALTGDQFLTMIEQWAVEPPILVLMDLNTPGTEGREALTVFRQMAVWQTVPLIVVSTSSNPRDVEFCVAAGVSAYQVKPFSYAEHLAQLVELFDYWLARSASAAFRGVGQ